MKPDGKSTKATTSATTDNKELAKRLKATLDVLWAVMGLKMALDRLKTLKFSVVADSKDGVATITVSFGKLGVDLDSGTVNGKDLDSAIVAIQEKLKEVQNEK